MATDVIREATVSSHIEAWARGMGVWDDRPVHVATAKATVAMRQGASVEEACAIGRSFVISWLRHPANGARGARVAEGRGRRRFADFTKPSTASAREDLRPSLSRQRADTLSR